MLHSKPCQSYHESEVVCQAKRNQLSVEKLAGVMNQGSIRKIDRKASCNAYPEVLHELGKTNYWMFVVRTMF